jgi:lysozyme
VNIQAFLAMVRFSEGTAKYPDPYRVCFEGRHMIADLSDHPSVTGEWLGERLDFLGPAYAGMHSDAAGAYQIIKPTWLGCKRILNLHDFTKPSQDAAATLLIKQKGALDLVNGGQVQAAIGLCASIWASLPGSSSGQPEQRLAQLIGAYSSAGGAFA